MYVYIFTILAIHDGNLHSLKESLHDHFTEWTNGSCAAMYFMLNMISPYEIGTEPSPASKMAVK